MYEFKLPDIGEGISEGEIVKWNVKPGDRIEKDRDMVEVMTDKVTVKIPSPISGTVKSLKFSEGQMAKVGDVIIEIETPDEEQAKENNPPAKETPKVEPTLLNEGKRTVQPTVSGEGPALRVLASPAVRRIARENDIDLALVPPSGENGRVTLDDLWKFVDSQSKALEKEREVPVKVENVKIENPPAKTEEVLEMHGLRRLIFDKMTKSKQNIPHYTVVESADLTKVAGMLEDYRAAGIKITYTSFFVKAATIALKEFPYLNANYNEDRKNYTLKKYYNIGIAVDTPDGLTVPVLKDADRKSLAKISGEIRDLAAKARNNSLSLQEVQDATFTVTNVGTIGGVMSTPIINYPEVAILGVHKVSEDVVNGGKRFWTYISLSCDHRLIDGAMGTRFLVRVKNLLENPVLLFLE